MREWYTGEEGGLIHKYLFYRIELKVLTGAEGKDFEVFRGKLIKVFRTSSKAAAEIHSNHSA